MPRFYEANRLRRVGRWAESLQLNMVSVVSVVSKVRDVEYRISIERIDSAEVFFGDSESRISGLDAAGRS